jgi:glucokinase
MAAGRAPRDLVAVLDVGGTHVAGAMVDMSARAVADGTRTRRALDPDGSADAILAAIVDCAAAAIGTAAVPRLGVAMPGPFDYAAGIGRFAGVAKFDALNGVDVGAALRAGLAGTIREVVFVNDADAFAFGEWAAGAARDEERPAAITIGTGIGSTFLDHGTVVEDGPRVPPTGRAWKIVIDGVPLEDRCSRRAILRAAAGHPALALPGADVHDLALAAEAGDADAYAVFDDAFDALGLGLGPWLARFDATLLAVGGSIAGSWGLLEGPLARGLARGEPAWLGPIRHATLGADAALLGAAIASFDRAPDLRQDPHLRPGEPGSTE